MRSHLRSRVNCFVSMQLTAENLMFTSNEASLIPPLMPFA